MHQCRTEIWAIERSSQTGYEQTMSLTVLQIDLTPLYKKNNTLSEHNYSKINSLVYVFGMSTEINNVRFEVFFSSMCWLWRPLWTKQYTSSLCSFCSIHLNVVLSYDPFFYSDSFPLLRIFVAELWRWGWFWQPLVHHIIWCLPCHNGFRTQ